jgi:uncharacterized alkaline shock family protein YloU
MVTKRTHLGNITVTEQFFKELIGRNIMSCFGVVGMNSDGAKQNFLDALPNLPFISKKKNAIDKGISFRFIKNQLHITLHITVMYGTNVSSVVKSIQHKIKYAVEEETDIPVERVNVFVDGIKT